MPDKEQSAMPYIYCVAFGLLVGWMITSDRHNNNPFGMFKYRNKGVDTIRQGDTLFVISHKIDTAIYDFDESIDKVPPNDNL
jgi:hypothetical protein